ncbi:cytochrome c biogenesis CcdA family protein [Halovenus rubra]|uniref:Cytochrome c biogenesis CcdA family protein n=2 Tax=Halovenus rubra TaxID=869890 RepID=A0ABD5X388_9EURY|nr:cytochrome c biogenesis protein CcdA [Halovenus rubra]
MSVTAQAGFAFGVGVTAFFSPCVFALLPGYIGYYVASVDSDSPPLSGAFARGGAASLGAVVAFAFLSVIAFAAGELLEQAIPVFEYLVAVLLVGLGILVFRKGALSLTVPLPKRRASVLGFGIFGAMYALASTACVLPLFLSVSVLSFEFAAVGTAIVLGAYAAGFASLMLAATVITAVGRQALLDTAVARTAVMTKVAGIVLVLAGLAQLAIAYSVEPAETIPF